MAERKSGPVRPPVIDLTARPADPPKPETPSEAAAAAATDAPVTSETAAVGATPAEAAKPAETSAVGPAVPAEAPKPVEAAKPGEISAAEAAVPADTAKSTEAPKPAETAATAKKPAEAPKPAAKTDSTSADAKKNFGEKGPAAPVAQPPARRSSPWGPAAAGAVGGAVIAVAVCYGLASSGLWPSSTADAQLGQLQDRLAQAEKSGTDNATALASLNTQLSGLQNDVTGRLGTASDTLTHLQQSVAALQSAKPAVDLAPLQDQVKTLSARVDAVAAGASSADAGAIAANLATVQQNLADLTSKVSALDSRAGATDNAISGLRSELDSAKSAIDQAAKAPSPQAIASAMQLPLLISALEADFAAGRPYAADLAKLTAAVPEAHVPASVSDAAANGLPAPDDLSRQLQAATPDILGAAPAGTDSSWQGQVGDWARRVLALRPQGEQQGDRPDAVVSRLQQAVDRHNFSGAATLFGQLPQPMQAAAGNIGTEIKTLADADSFVSGLRQTALAPAAGAQQ